MTVCKHILYSGKVQGIGFRSMAQWLAATYSIAGYVRNLPSGEVEVVAEGEENAIETFLAAVAQRMAGYIRNTTIQDAAPTGQRGFQIRR